MKTNSLIFYVVTKSCSIHEVKLTKNKISVEKIFSTNPKLSKVGVGYILGPKYKFLGLTQRDGLWKFMTSNGQKPEAINGYWNGSHIHTSEIVGLFLQNESAINFCKNDYLFNPAAWFTTKESKDVLAEIKDHPLVLIDEFN